MPCGSHPAGRWMNPATGLSAISPASGLDGVDPTSPAGRATDLPGTRPGRARHPHRISSPHLRDSTPLVELDEPGLAGRGAQLARSPCSESVFSKWTGRVRSSRTCRCQVARDRWSHAPSSNASILPPPTGGAVAAADQTECDSRSHASTMAPSRRATVVDVTHRAGDGLAGDAFDRPPRERRLIAARRNRQPPVGTPPRRFETRSTAVGGRQRRPFVLVKPRSVVATAPHQNVDGPYSPTNKARRSAGTRTRDS